ncbi:Serine/threonine protein kinase [Thermomonospora echinospora]|uniref:Serine/threonine protein kinase n=1 Tax=Thermomonospora echinospora TaxID=1992 RepID=A0A1H6DKV9_9ACTN|nr:protein kinase [Thermomonospora echinospora]SEG85473.1 Serine/threonine protein kinase [Thermomonospora echinospora]
MREVEPLRLGDPRLLGAFRLTGRLGAGERGVVYLGETPSGAAVVIRAMLPGPPAGEAGTGVRQAVTVRRAAVREVAAARQVASSWTARVLAADVDADVPYIVSEYVAGPSLAQVVERHGPRIGSALHLLAAGTIQGLAAVHRAGLVHGDFRPAAVVLGADGPRVVDFAVHGLMGDEETAGRPAFQAPEQLSGGDATAAADVFAWAATMVFASCGRPPFGLDADPATATRVLRQQPDLGMLAGRLQEIALRCLAKDPRQRPSSADIAGWLQRAEQPLQAAPPRRPGTPRRGTPEMTPVAGPAAATGTPGTTEAAGTTEAGRPHEPSAVRPAPPMPPTAADSAPTVPGPATDPIPGTAGAVTDPALPALGAVTGSALEVFGPVTGSASMAPGAVTGSVPMVPGPATRPASAGPEPVTGSASGLPGAVTGSASAFPGTVTDPASPVPGAVADPALGVAGSVTGSASMVPGAVADSALLAPRAVADVAQGAKAHDTSGIEVRIRGRAVGRRRAGGGAARRRAARSNSLIAGIAAGSAAVGLAIFVWTSGIADFALGRSSVQPVGDPVGRVQVPRTGPAVEVATAGGYRYRLAAVGRGVDQATAPATQSSTSPGTLYVHADYVLRNPLDRPVLLDLYTVDLFVKRDLLPERSRGLCMWHNGVPEDMCTPPAKPQVMSRLSGDPPTGGTGGDRYMAPGASYVVRVTVDVPLADDPGPGDLRLYVWKQTYMTDTLVKEVPFPR